MIDTHNKKSLPPESATFKKGTYATLFLLVVMLIGSVVCYKEKLLFSDFAHYLFRIINDDALQIGAYRWGMAITQFLPYVGAKLHLPLTTLMILFSASFYLLCIAVALLMSYKFRQPALALLLGLYVTLFVSESYYYLNSEGIPVLLLGFAMLFYLGEKKKPEWFQLLIFTAFFFLAIWTHPLVIPAAVYLWFFFLDDKRHWPLIPRQTIVYTAILFVFVFLKFYQGMNHGYDSAKIEMVTGFKPQTIATIYTAPQFKYFMKSCVTNYWLLTMIWFAGIVALIRENKYFLVALTLFFTASYILLVCITYWSAQSARFYMEIEYMPLSIICAAPFVYYVLPKMNVKMGVAVILLIYCIRLIYIYNSVTPFTNHLAFLKKVNTRMQDKKLTRLIVTDLDQKTDSMLMLSWGMQLESLMLSKLDGEQPQRTFLFATPDEAKGYVNTGKDTFLGCWEKRPVTHLNAHYFTIDTTTGYRVISLPELLR